MDAFVRMCNHLPGILEALEGARASTATKGEWTNMNAETKTLLIVVGLLVLLILVGLTIQAVNQSNKASTTAARSVFGLPTTIVWSNLLKSVHRFGCEAS